MAARSSDDVRGYMRFNRFRKIVALSREEICREIYLQNRDRIKIKKEKVAIANLVKIFNATLALSNKKGFHAMSLRDLSKETGLSMGALYSYFSSKDELVDIIQTQGRRVTAQVLHDQIAHADRPREKLRRAIISHLSLSEVLYPWFYFSYMEARNLSKKQLKKAIESELLTERIFVDILKRGSEEGIFAFPDTNLTAAVIKAVLQDWYMKRWKYASRGTSVEDYAVFVVDFVENFILA